MNHLDGAPTGLPRPWRLGHSNQREPGSKNPFLHGLAFKNGLVSYQSDSKCIAMALKASPCVQKRKMVRFVGEGFNFMDQSTAKFMLQEYDQLRKLCLHQSSLLQKLGQSVSAPEHGERLIRLPELLKRCGISQERTVYRLEAAGRFPTRRQLGPRAVGWAESEVRTWMADPAGWLQEVSDGLKTSATPQGQGGYYE